MLIIAGCMYNYRELKHAAYIASYTLLIALDNDKACIVI